MLPNFSREARLWFRAGRAIAESCVHVQGDEKGQRVPWNHTACGWVLAGLIFLELSRGIRQECLPSRHICRCIEGHEFLKVRPPGRDLSCPLSTSPEANTLSWAPQPAMPTTHGQCLCGRPEPSFRAWAYISSCFLPPGPHTLTVVSKHNCAYRPGTPWNLRVTMALPSISVPLRLLRASLPQHHPFPGPRPLIVLCPLPGVPCPTPDNSVLPCVGLRTGEASEVQQTWFDHCSWAGQLCRESYFFSLSLFPQL